MKLERESPMPLYYQLKQLILEQIRQEKLQKGQKLPTEEELCMEHSLSRFTVRQALQELEAEGWIEKRQGRGTFVAEPRIPLSVAWQLLGFTEDMRRKGHRVESRIIEATVLAAKIAISDRLKIEKGTQVFFLQRLRLVDGEPFVFDQIHIRRDLCPGIEKIDMTNRSLFQVFENEYGIGIKKATRTLQIALASGKIAEFLSVKKGAPVFLLTDLLYSGDNSPLQVAETFINESKSQFVFELIRPDNAHTLDSINLHGSTYPTKK